MSPGHKVLQVLARLSNRPAGEIRPEMALVSDLGIDSPKVLELLVELEDALEIEITDEDAAELETVGELVAYVEQQA